jgi:hypothetical protein
MDTHNEHLDTLKDIKNMMERSSRFLSLNGFSGVFVGIFALCGVWVANRYIESTALIPGMESVTETTPYYHFALQNGHLRMDFIQFFMLDAILILILSVLAGSLLTMRKAKKDGVKIWDNTAKRLLINMMIPLVSGGIFCLIITYHGVVQFVAPAMLIFYGMALINSSKYTFEDIRYLGLLEIGLGLLGTLYIDHGLLFWAIGFGVLHIIYGTVMYFKYGK